MGSSRSHGNTRIIADYLVKNTSAELIDLNKHEIGYFDYEHNNREDDFLSLIEKILDYEVILLSTPVYWYSMSAQMKTFIDRISDLLKIRKDLGRQLRGKKMMVTATSSDDTEYPEFWIPFQRTAEYLGMDYLGHAHTWIEKNELPHRVKQTLNGLIDRLN